MKEAVYQIEDGELLDIELGDGVTELIIPEEVEEISSSTFQLAGMSQIVSVQLPEHLEQLEAGVFNASFKHLETIRLGSHIRKIDKGAVFAKCSTLKTVEIAAKKADVKLSPFSFPASAEILWLNETEPAEPEKYWKLIRRPV